MSDNPVYEKLLKIRAKTEAKLKPCKHLRDTIIKSDGTEIPLTLRPYQVQMVYHMLLMKNFICGDDTGCGKCISGESLVSTTSGLVQIRDMHDWSNMEPDTFAHIDRDWKVLVDGESLPVKNFYYGGTKPTIKVKTRYGFETEGSRVHPLLVWRDCEHQWVEMQNLQEGDYLCVERREMDFPESEPYLDTEIDVNPRAVKHALPDRMNPDLARLLAYLVGEGTLSSRLSTWVSQCPEHNPEAHADIVSLWKSCFNVVPSRAEKKDMVVHSTHIRQCLYQNGLRHVKSPKRTIPDCILRSTRESNRQFLRGIFEGEGHVNKSGIEFSTSSKELGRQLQVMLLRFGIVSNMSYKKVKGYEHNDYWRLTIYGKDARIFRDKIGFVSSRRQDALNQALDCSTNPNHDIIPEAKPLIEDLRALLKEALTKTGANANRKGSGLKQYGVPFVNTLNNIRNNGRNPTYGFLHKLLAIAAENGLEQSIPYLRLQALTETHYFYDPIFSLEEGEAEVFDIEVDDPRHCFIANGLVNHNTLETIATLCYLWEKDPTLKPIVATTTSAMRQWGGEIDKFTRDVDWVIAEGSPKAREAIYEEFFATTNPERPKVLITNYPRLRKDKRAFKEHSEGSRYLLVADEASAFKSTSSQTHKVCAQIAKGAERVYGLTATLIKNNLVEGYGIFKVVCPGVFSTKTAFINNYCVTKMQPIGNGRKVKVVVGHSKDHIELFRGKIDPYMLGRAKHEVATDLPTLTTKEIRVPMNHAQWDYYNDALEGLLTVYEGTEDEEEKEVTKLTSLIYCQQIANDPYLIGNEGVSTKVDMLLSLLEEDFAEEKVIVFTRFRKMVDRFQELLEAKGYTYSVDKVGKEYKANKTASKGFARVTGSEDGNEREAGRVAFTESDGTNIIFLTMAGAEAMNLQEARVFIFFDLPWSAGDFLQLVGRMIRIGSPHQSVYAVQLLAEGPYGDRTIDHHVSATLDKKMGFIEGALGARILGNGDSQEDEFLDIGSDTNDLFEQMCMDARARNKE